MDFKKIEEITEFGDVYCGSGTTWATRAIPFCLDLCYLIKAYLICKGIFVILKLMVYPVHIDICPIYTVKHRVAVLFKMDGAVTVLLKLWMGTIFQGSCNNRQTIPGFQGILPYAMRSLSVQQGVLNVINIAI